MSVRSIADAIRALDAEALAELLRARPDLMSPPPTGLPELIERAASASSTQLALDRLNAWQLRVLHTIAALGEEVTVDRVAQQLRVARSAVQPAVGSLTGRALLWTASGRLHPTLAVRTAFGPHPAGLATASAQPLTTEQITAGLAAAGQAGRAVLDRLVWGPPTGAVRHATRAVQPDSASPVDRLLALGLLRPIDQDTVILPREVSLYLRGGELFPDPVPRTLPAWPDTEPSTVSDLAGLGSAVELVQHATALLDALSDTPPRALAHGGISRKDLASLAAITGNEQLTGFVLELAHAAGLVSTLGSVWLPTRAYDRWLERGGWGQWDALRQAYAQLDSWPAADRHALDPGAATSWASAVRRAALAQLPPTASGTPIEPGVLADRLGWLHPSWVPLGLADIAQVLTRELTRLGLVGLGRRTALVDAVEDPGFPAPVETVTIQSDLTAIASGPLRHDVARVISVLARRESHGGGTVHRFTRDSIRAAMDAGWGAEQILDWVGSHTSTGVPQPLRYLVGDVARQYGRVEVTAAASVMTVDDPQLVQTLLGHQEAAGLGLRLLAPGVLMALAEPDELVAFLHTLGLAPLARAADGERWTTPPARRAPGPVRPASPTPVDADLLAARLLAAPQPSPGHRIAELLATLSRAQESGDWVRLDYVTADGAVQQAQARVLAIGQGAARIVPRAAPPVTLQLSRIVSASTSTDPEDQ